MPQRCAGRVPSSGIGTPPSSSGKARNGSGGGVMLMPTPAVWSLPSARLTEKLSTEGMTLTVAMSPCTGLPLV